MRGRWIRPRCLLSRTLLYREERCHSRAAHRLRQQCLRRMVEDRRSRDCHEVRGIKAHRGGGRRCLLVVGQVMGRVRPSHVSQDIGQTTAHCTSAASCMVLRPQSIRGQLSKRIHGGEVKALRAAMRHEGTKRTCETPCWLRPVLSRSASSGCRNYCDVSFVCTSTIRQQQQQRAGRLYVQHDPEEQHVQ